MLSPFILVSRVVFYCEIQNVPSGTFDCKRLLFSDPRDHPRQSIVLYCPMHICSSPCLRRLNNSAPVNTSVDWCEDIWWHRMNRVYTQLGNACRTRRSVWCRYIQVAHMYSSVIVWKSTRWSPWQVLDFDIQKLTKTECPVPNCQSTEMDPLHFGECRAYIWYRPCCQRPVTQTSKKEKKN